MGGSFNGYEFVPHNTGGIPCEARPASSEKVPDTVPFAGVDGLLEALEAIVLVFGHVALGVLDLLETAVGVVAVDHGIVPFGVDHLPEAQKYGSIVGLLCNE